MARIALELHRGLPDLAHVAALEAEGAHERLALEVGGGGDDADRLRRSPAFRGRSDGGRDQRRAGGAEDLAAGPGAAAHGRDAPRAPASAIAFRRTSRSRRIRATAAFRRSAGRAALRERVLEVHRDRRSDTYLGQETEERHEVDRPLAQRVGQRLPALLRPRPVAVLDVESVDEWSDQAETVHPRSAALDDRVTDVVLAAEPGGAHILQKEVQVPHGGAHPLPRVVLVAAPDPAALVERGQVAQGRAQSLERAEDAAGAVVVEVAETVVANAEAPRRPQDRLRVRVPRRRECGRHHRDRRRRRPGRPRPPSGGRPPRARAGRGRRGGQ